MVVICCRLPLFFRPKQVVKAGEPTAFQKALTIFQKALTIFRKALTIFQKALTIF